MDALLNGDLSGGDLFHSTCDSFPHSTFLKAPFIPPPLPVFECSYHSVIFSLYPNCPTNFFHTADITIFGRENRFEFKIDFKHFFGTAIDATHFCLYSTNRAINIRRPFVMYFELVSDLHSIDPNSLEWLFCSILSRI